MSPPQSGELTIELFELPGGALATFTGRAQGNMSSVGGDGAEHGLEARERLREALGVRRLVRGYQVHGTVVGRVLADGTRAGLDSGEHALANGVYVSLDSGEHALVDGVRAGLDSGEHALANGVYVSLDSGEHALVDGVRAGLDSGEHALANGVYVSLDSGEHALVDGVRAGLDSGEHALADGVRANFDSGERPARPHIEVQAPVSGRQFEHGPENVFECEDSASQPAFEADGHAVAAPGLAAMVLTADCIPVALGARGAVAALHAGWRGLAAGVLEEGVRAVRELGGSGDIVAVVGPCAGACCYEVGEEVHAAFAGRSGAHRDGRLIDLRAIAHEKLLAAGVAEVLDAKACTICDERFFSHRREEVRAGRQAGLVWIAQ